MLAFAFQLTAARRRLAALIGFAAKLTAFQLTAARRRLAKARNKTLPDLLFQLTAARRRLGVNQMRLQILFRVSTHSRPKAAGVCLLIGITYIKFQLTAARRRLEPCK